ncbi:MFS transporter [Streptomyces cadmiisoli]|uniref:MFS transporter n=1 Tax=Streptomyces cadmiisoli TaxID=2184053 RepID=A0A2Z4J8V2_9ACTN|nr:MFS transporter [Streptomyces cadmiisoli]AWW41466.1 MFS transporter [Streptomyces cadmiisoli]
MTVTSSAGPDRSQPSHGAHRHTRAGKVGHGKAFWLIAFAYMINLAHSAVPAPLWSIYQEQHGFSTFTITVVFASYSIGVIISLFLVGHLSDWHGRRRLLLIGVLTGAVSALMAVTSTALPVLIVTRLVVGFGIGMVTATATAYLIDLHGRARPGASRTRADIVATVANVGGLAIGALVGGLLAEYVAGPLRTPYLLFLGLLLVSAIGVVLSPETVELSRTRPPYRPQRVSVPHAARGTFFAASAATFAAFGAFGLFTSLGPGFIAGTLHEPSRTLAGLAAFMVFGAAAVTQTSLLGVAQRKLLTYGLLLMPLGLIAVTAAVWQADLALFLGAGVITGAGAGLLFKGSVSTVLGLAEPESRSETLAGLFLAAYSGLALPILGIGVATRFISDKTALIGFTAVLITLCAVGTRRLLSPRHTASAALPSTQARYESATDI